MQRDTNANLTSGGTLHNIKEKIQHPFRHDTDSNITFPTHEQKKQFEHQPTTGAGLGSTDVGGTSTVTSTTVPPSSGLSTGTTSSTLGTTSNIPRESEYDVNKKKW
ncbi:hypothetical protein FDP41_011272 [Naegleria fowleri]|uniref:Uncharacterized protein n=1 Tax=Naegleria fowleri TaxID=5763 RepID=A0A6A5C687_NAEFO|nr:uncharacterized protein FDP41_011272 [Naegleria fowleri]KAF0982342.1 hypothetical protein FDP41_011272 [Naegleria fowleri]CAG4718244.1 unnamed protein product [Naegleria fowleri]